MPPWADYGKQLADIAVALNRPTFPTWAIALFAASLGAILSFAAQVALRPIDNWWEVRRFRRILYRDLYGIFCALEDAPQYHPSDDGVREELTESIQFDAEVYLKGDQKIYMQLPERMAANEIYHRLHTMFSSASSIRANADNTAVHIAVAVANGTLETKYFKAFVDKKNIQEFLSRAKEINDDYNHYVEGILKRKE